MSRMRFHTTIQRSAESVYQLILDISGYKAWLSPSSLYSATVLVTDYPVRVGTIYTDRGTMSVMEGEITEIEPFKRITFQQSTHQQPSFFTNSITITIRYTLAEVAGSTRVTRDVIFHTHGLLFLAQIMLLRRMRPENERILGAMKTYLEARVA